ncbi:MAG: hypothetical protein MPK62_14745, partial [Alphaproteobacteria bacterium]|nr:hypothetical protein [Alphaproteobacteria bacterium]
DVYKRQVLAITVKRGRLLSVSLSRGKRSKLMVISGYNTKTVFIPYNHSSSFPIQIPSLPICHAWA